MFKNNYIGNKTTILCGDGSHKIKLEKNFISTSMRLPEYKSDTLFVNNYKGKYVDSGAKHFVVLVDSVYDVDVELEGSKIRYDDFFLPTGINVNFYSLEGLVLHVRTYEKGVESEMLSCGSGSVACAYDAFNKGLVLQETLIKVKGGDLMLKANYERGDVWLSGPAKLVYNGEIKYKEINGE